MSYTKRVVNGANCVSFGVLKSVSHEGDRQHPETSWIARKSKMASNADKIEKVVLEVTPSG